MAIANSAEFASDEKKSERRGALLYFVDWLHTGPVRIFILTLFVLHITASTYLCTQVNTDFDMENLYLKRSPLTQISRKMQKFVLEESFVVNFALDSMPSFEDPAVRERFSLMIHDLENIPIYGMGDKGTTLWTKEYELAISFWGEDDTLWKPDELFKNYKEYGLDRKFITTRKDDQQNEIIDGFFWWITYHNMHSFLDVQKMMDKRRAILAKYSHEFNVSSHHPLEKVPTESAASAPENFIQTAVSAIILMSCLVFLFVLDINAIVSVVMSIISICSGTVGYLHLWGVHLDAVSLISMLMSIGFSVDYSAHICYHFFTHVKEDDEESSGADVEQSQDQKSPKNDRSSRARLEDTFKGVGWPVIQSGLSTVLGMIPLVLVQAYVVAVFWKTIILVTLLGMFHALFLLPVLFLSIEDVYRYFKSLYSKNR
uniref:SSD domain-containing protein n=1 Tax=Steinernema glaseri TaxID=37863 RepID=A0A1I8ACH0_9BILA